MEICYYVYIIIMFFAAVILSITSGSKHPVITFILTYWLLAGVVLQSPVLLINIPALGFDLRPPRIISILFAAYLLFSTLTRNPQNPLQKKVPFEKYLYIYICLVTASLTYNAFFSNSITLKDMLLNLSLSLSYLIIYVVVKKTLDYAMMQALIRALLVVGFASSIVSIYQYFIDPDFFRFGVSRLAFNDVLRANGIFESEYTNGYFIISAAAAALFFLRSIWKKICFMCLFTFAIVLTFHRMVWIVYALLPGFYLLLVRKKRGLVFFLSCGIAAIVVFASFSYLSPPDITKLPVVRNRVMEETFEIRMAFYKATLEEVPKHFLFGVGTSKSSIFYQKSIEAFGSDLSSDETTNQAWIHNGYLMAAFFHGIPALLSFILFLLSAFICLLRRAWQGSLFLFFAAFEILKFILANVTNGFYIFDYLGLLFAIILGAAAAIYRQSTIESEKW